MSVAREKMGGVVCGAWKLLVFCALGEIAYGTDAVIRAATLAQKRSIAAPGSIGESPMVQAGFAAKLNLSRNLQPSYFLEETP